MHLRGGTTTSETIAQMLHTNPVVVRRTMAVLRDAGYVTSFGGHGGGWALARPVEELTLREVYDALSPRAIFAIGPAQDNPACPVEREVNRFLVESLEASETLLLERLAATRVGDLVPRKR